MSHMSKLHIRKLEKKRKKQNSQVQTVTWYPDKNPKPSITRFKFGFSYRTYQDIFGPQIPHASLVQKVGSFMEKLH